MPRKKSTKKTAETVKENNPLQEESKHLDFFDRITRDLQQNQSYLNMILGGLIVIVVAVLLVNYFKRQADNLGPSTQTSNPEQSSQPSSEPPTAGSKYTVKEGDTLFSIAQTVYDDGSKYPEIMKSNKLSDENNILVGQVLDIPQEMSPSPSPSPSSAP